MSINKFMDSYISNSFALKMIVNTDKVIYDFPESFIYLKYYKM